MLLKDLCAALPGRVLRRRAAKEEIGMPELIMFLTKPDALRIDVLYLLDAKSAETILPLPEVTLEVRNDLIKEGRVRSLENGSVSVERGAHYTRIRLPELKLHELLVLN